MKLKGDPKKLKIEITLPCVVEVEPMSIDINYFAKEINVEGKQYLLYLLMMDFNSKIYA